jgi:hypothetical protein
LLQLSELYPTKLSLGMEIRVKVCDYVQDRIKALRIQHQAENKFNNIACLRSNAMKYLPNFFKKGQVIDSREFIGSFSSWGLNCFLIFSSRRYFFCTRILISKRPNTNGV